MIHIGSAPPALSGGNFRTPAGVYGCMRIWLRTAGLGVAGGLWLRGQIESVGWDPRQVGPTWQQEYLMLAVTAAALYGYWWFFRWLIRRRLDRTGWRATRVIWPTGALALAGLAVAVGSTGMSDAVADILGAVAALVNLPLIPVAFLAGLLAWFQLPAWVVVAAGTAAAWFWWWVIVIFFEERAQPAGPIKLGI